ncbi:translation initiation factor IF-2-like [Canis lupus familiaris]|uniref:translation initiation factor IF-2-like n=1 Tax=Canis lupus familiaris TaxID=9615 RepID=UPI0003ADAB2B|nr:translation initiation factor IF-2-like [Canis lupus familiaris]XP_038295261.1 translation initiation factor IF-2-like [Canis lupus familiaris]|eukprot:XP_005637367.1 uncharacterized protein LOC102155834 [Canis lupus familiaris]
MRGRAACARRRLIKMRVSCAGRSRPAARVGAQHAAGCNDGADLGRTWGGPGAAGTLGLGLVQGIEKDLEESGTPSSRARTGSAAAVSRKFSAPAPSAPRSRPCASQPLPPRRVAPIAPRGRSLPTDSRSRAEPAAGRERAGASGVGARGRCAAGRPPPAPSRPPPPADGPAPGSRLPA